MVGFISLYLYLNVDQHLFVGNVSLTFENELEDFLSLSISVNIRLIQDKVCSRFFLATYWSCVTRSERQLVLKNGFYRMFQGYLMYQIHCRLSLDVFCIEAYDIRLLLTTVSNINVS
jgi:hypothetical protein